MSPVLTAELDRLFRPRAVAVVGASPDPDKIGSAIVRNLQHVGFDGAIYPINPRWPEIDGLECHPSVSALPEAPDVVYLLIPAAQVPDAARDAADRGARFAIVSASGFAEAGTDEARARQAALSEIVDASGLRIVGPNCNGIYNAPGRVSIGFNSAHAKVLAPGTTTVLSHSGALFSPIAQRATRLRVGLSKFVSLGNEVDLDMLDFLAHAVRDDETQTVALLLDSIRHGDRFASLVDELRAAGKTVLALPFGQSEVGASAAVAHSGRLATDKRLTRSFLDCLGVGHVETVEALLTACALAARPPRPGAGAACFTFSGGAGAIFADAAERAGVPVPALTPQTVATLEALSDHAEIANPVDMGQLRRPTADMPPALAAIADDPGVSDVVVALHEINDAGYAWLVPGLVEAGDLPGARLTVLTPGGLPGEIEGALQDGGVLLVHETRSLVEALAAVYAAAGPSGRAPAGATPSCRGAGAANGTLTELDSLRLVERAGVPVVPCVPLPDAAAVIGAGDELGWPLVVKGVARGVGHKSELGLVRVGVRDADEATAAWEQVCAALSGLDAVGAIAQPMVSGGVEVIVGALTDERLGAFLLAGLGGVHVEALDLVVLTPAWADDAALRERIAAAPLGRVLTDDRTALPGALDAVVGVLSAIRGLLAADPAIREVDINPLLVRPDGPIAVDALVVAAPIPGGDT